MNIRLSSKLMDDLAQTVQIALSSRGIVNVPVLAEEIRQRHQAENVALEDIAAQLMAQAQSFSAAMEFDSPRTDLN